MEYAGDVQPGEAWTKLQDDPRAVLVDVRTKAEWAYVGLPDLTETGKQPICVEWQVYPAMTLNEGFAAELSKQGIGPDNTVLLLCRSGVRSAAAAKLLTGMGWPKCYNVAGGFEGPLDPEKRRGTVGGWKVAGLPWKQS